MHSKAYKFFFEHKIFNVEQFAKAMAKEGAKILVNDIVNSVRP